jgi:hypothetical protein
MILEIKEEGERERERERERQTESARVSEKRDCRLE